MNMTANEYLNKVTTLSKVTLTGEQIKQIQTAIKQMGKPIIPVLGNVKFNLTGDNLTAYLTNISIIAELKFNLDTYNLDTYNLDTYNDNTTFFISFDELKRIKASKKDTITLEIEQDKIKINQNGITKSLVNIDLTDEFPKLPDLKDPLHTITVDQKYIKALLDAIPFVSNSGTRPALLFINNINGSIIATDSYRLFQSNDKFETITDNFLVSTSTAKLVSDLMESAVITIYDRYIQYSNGRVTITQYAQKISYPDTSKIIQLKFTGEVTVNVNDLLPVLEQIKKTKVDKNNTTKINFSSGKMTITAGNNSITAEINADTTYLEDGFNIYLNADYLLQSLKQIKKEKVELKFTGQLSPIVVTSKEDEFHLILPIKINK